MIALAWVSFWSALIPLAVLGLFRRDAPGPYWVVAIAWTLAVFQDAHALLDGGTWMNSHAWPVLAFSLLALSTNAALVYVLAAAFLMALFAWVQLWFPLVGPDLAVTVIGSAFVLRFARPHLRPAMIAYCGAGSLFMVGYGLTLSHYWVATSFWLAYKAATLTAFGLFLRRAAWK